MGDVEEDREFTHADDLAEHTRAGAHETSAGYHALLEVEDGLPLKQNHARRSFLVGGPMALLRWILSLKVSTTAVGAADADDRPFLRSLFNFPEPDLALRSTAWLDGLRGLAAFEVFIFHYDDGWITRTLSFGSGENNSSPEWYYMPFVRTIYTSGDASVCLFFAISGYVLAHNLLVLLRRQEYQKLYWSLTSAIFRRAIRLYMPVLIETFILMLLCRLFGVPKAMPYEDAPSFLAELWEWCRQSTQEMLPQQKEALKMINRYDGGISWTIPLEYYGSLQIYTAVLFLSQIQNFAIRQLLLCMWIAKSFARDDWIAFQFLIGMALADYYLQCAQEDHRPWLQSRKLRSRLFAAIFIFGFYLSGLPPCFFGDKDNIAQTLVPRPYFDWLIQPLAYLGFYDERRMDRYLMCLASLCCLVAVPEVEYLKRIAESRIVQYLGKISFGLYLCHIFIRAWLNPVKLASFWLLGIDAESPDGVSHLRWFCAYLLFMAVAVIVNCIVAGLFERFLDKPSIRAGKIFEQWCLSKNDSSSLGTRTSLPTHSRHW
ncbi:hypothetical protein ANO11243_079840 [Dothideomycetidae sp. 11243]|nr:hypothetical protein ANO11243_079840 [fungal sp. No.11243]